MFLAHWSGGAAGSTASPRSSGPVIAGEPHATAGGANMGFQCLHRRRVGTDPLDQVRQVGHAALACENRDGFIRVHGSSLAGGPLTAACTHSGARWRALVRERDLIDHRHRIPQPSSTDLPSMGTSGPFRPSTLTPAARPPNRAQREPQPPGSGRRTGCKPPRVSISAQGRARPRWPELQPGRARPIGPPTAAAPPSINTWPCAGPRGLRHGANQATQRGLCRFQAVAMNCGR